MFEMPYALLPAVILTLVAAAVVWVNVRSRREAKFPGWVETETNPYMLKRWNRETRSWETRPLTDDEFAKEFESRAW